MRFNPCGIDLLAIFLTISICFLYNQGVECQAKKLKKANWKQGKATEKEYLLDSSKLRNFQQSKAFCDSQRNGATLVMIKKQKEQLAVHGLISSASSK